MKKANWEIKRKKNVDVTNLCNMAPVGNSLAQKAYAVKPGRNNQSRIVNRLMCGAMMTNMI